MSNWNNRPTQNNTSKEVSVDLKDVTSLKTNTADKSSKGTMILWIIFFIFLTVIVLAAILVPLILAVTYSGPFATTSTTAGSVTTVATVTNATTTTTTTVVTTITYSQSFTTGSAATAQCTQWQSFAALLTVRSYTLLTVRGTFDSAGKVANDPIVIGNIALALRTSGSYGPVTSNGVLWTVGTCVSGIELSALGGICGCPTTGYSVRPCIGNINYGGVNTTICSGPSQILTVIFQY